MTTNELPAHSARASLKLEAQGAAAGEFNLTSRAQCAGLIEAAWWRCHERLQGATSRAQCAGLIEASDWGLWAAAAPPTSRAQCAGLIEASVPAVMATLPC